MKKLALTVVLIAMASTAYARDQISIVGSSTVFPFATTVAEKFGQGIGYRTPVIESTGSGGGLKMFCGGIGTNTPDITNASRAIKEKEKAFAENKFTHWNQINPDLPNTKIDIMIPPTTSGTRDAFVELIMHDVCRKVYGMDKKKAKAACTNVRSKGTYVVQMTENDNLIIEKLVDDVDRLGVFGFSFLDQNPDKVQAATIDGVYPTSDTIADGSYKVSRPLFFYVKKEHIGVIPGIEEYVKLFMSDSMIGENGVLFEQGLIPLAR